MWGAQDIFDALGSFLEPSEQAEAAHAPDTATWVPEHRGASSAGASCAGAALDADAAFEKGIALYEQGYDDELVRTACACHVT